MSLPELLEYFTEMEVEAGSDPAVPLFPVHKPQSHVHRWVIYSVGVNYVLGSIFFCRVPDVLVRKWLLSQEI